jgi:cell division septum initiation protein DivIVA
MEETIRSGWHMPGTSRCMVDEAELQDILESIRENIPEQIRQADKVMQEHDQLLSQAKAEAERAIAAAQSQALELVQEQALFKTAEREARRIIEEANQQAQEIRARADEYAVGSLEALERQMVNTLGTVRNGISSLRDQASAASE